MSESEDFLFNYLHSEVARRMGNGVFDVFRPDYTDASTPEVPIYSGITMKAETGGGKLLEPPIPGLATYRIWSPLKKELRSGDILRPAGSTGSCATDYDAWPVITVVVNRRQLDTVALLTNRLGAIHNTLKKKIYTNVMFDFYSGNPTPGLTPDFLGSDEVEQRRIALFARVGVKNGYRFVDDLGQRWKINQVNGTGNLQILDLSRDVS